MAQELDLGSIADWIAAAGTVTTALIAIPATLAFLRDRRAARAAKAELRPWGATNRQTAMSLRFGIREPDRSQDLIVKVRVCGKTGARLQARDKTEYNPKDGDRVVEAAPPPSRELTLPLSRYTDAEELLAAYFDIIPTRDEVLELAMEVRRDLDRKVVLRLRLPLSVRRREPPQPDF